MEHLKKWILVLCLTWTVIRCATSNHSSLLDSITKEFGARLKKLSSDYHLPRKNTQTENLYKKVNRAGHDSAVLPPPKDNAEQKRNFVHNTSALSPFLKAQKNNSRHFSQHRTFSTSPSNDTKSKEDEKQNLIRSQNLHFNKIEPFWPFSNLTASILDNSFKPLEPNSGFPYSSLPERFKDTTFFFSHMGPNRFEYRAQFHHTPQKFHQPKDFQPFVHEFPEFPKITFPPFPAFPETPEIFRQQPRYPSFPDFNSFEFPTLPPAIKRNLHPPAEPKVPENNNNQFDGPFNRYDVGLGDISSKYPKIFRFNEERINIEDFERQKKRQAKINALNNNLLEPENVQRSHLLILHGGIFTVQEPPLYHRKVLRKRRQRLRHLKRIGNIPLNSREQQ